MLFIKLGQHLGLGYTLLLMVIAGFVGVTLAKHQGFLMLRQLQQRLSRGEMPTDEIIDSLLVLIGAVLLITPGIITDVLGFLILIPLTRGYFRKIAKGFLWGYIATGKIRFRRIR